MRDGDGGGSSTATHVPQLDRGEGAGGTWRDSLTALGAGRARAGADHAGAATLVPRLRGGVGVVRTLPAADTPSALPPEGARRSTSQDPGSHHVPQAAWERRSEQVRPGGGAPGAAGDDEHTGVWTEKLRAQLQGHRIGLGLCSLVAAVVVFKRWSASRVRSARRRLKLNDHRGAGMEGRRDLSV